MKIAATKLIAQISLACLLLSIIVPAPTPVSAHATPKIPTNQQAQEAYGKLPINFEANQGQSDPAVKFLARGQGYTLFLTDTGATLKLRSQQAKVETAILRLGLIGAQPRPEGKELLEGKVNYLIGNDQSKWHSNIPTYRQVRYQEVWTGIDMVWYSNQKELEYDFVVKPGADPSRIRFALQGAQNLHIDPQGNLVAQTTVGDVVQRTPMIYQDTDQGRQTIRGKFLVKDANEIGFEIGEYDRSKQLVIDPVLVYSTYFGSTATDEILGMAVDNLGQAYIGGKTFAEFGGPTFPIGNAIQPDGLNRVAFVAKMNADGSNFLYSTFLANPILSCTTGENFEICGAQVLGVAVGTGGEAVITGALNNEYNVSTYPVTDNAFQDSGPDCLIQCAPHRDTGEIDTFVTMLKPDGSGLIYSTFFGGGARYAAGHGRGTDVGKSVAVDSANRIYVAGFTNSNDLPTKNAYQNSSNSGSYKTDAFVAVFDPRQREGRATLLYASYLGGRENEQGLGIAVDNARNAYVVGSTQSEDLKTKSSASLPPLQGNFQGGQFDGFIAKFGTTASGESSLTYLTYFGGDINDRVESVAVDSAQRAYITGASNSSSNRFPLKNAFDSTQQNGEAFVAKLNADGTALFYCSFLGGANGNTAQDGEEGLGITIDLGGNAYVTGRTTSEASFPIGPVAPVFAGTNAGTAFIAKVGATISSTTTPKLLYSTTFGGRTAKAEAISLDPKGNVYIAGTSGGDLPTTLGAFQPKFEGFTDGFVAKFSATINDTIGVFRPSANAFLQRNSNTAGPENNTISFGVAGDLPVTGDWDGNGTDDIGIFRPSTGQFRLRFQNFIQTTITMTFGQNGDLPVAGDWNGDGIDTIGVFRPSTGEWLVTNGPNINNTTPPVNFQFVFGQNGDIPIAADWNGDGIDTPGLFRSGVTQFILSNGFAGTIDITPFTFGALGVKPMAGDWDGDGVATIGVFNPGTATMSLNNTNTSGNGIGDLVFSFGLNGDIPLGGNWDGLPETPVN